MQSIVARKVVAIIPARGGSKTVPRKNILPIAGHPLIAYSIGIAKLSKRIHEVIVSTDCPEIAAIATDYGAEVPFLRPASISQDHSTDIELFKHYYDFLGQRNWPIPELVVHLRPTSPFRNIAQMDSAIEFMQDNLEPTALRSMYPTPLTPYKMFKEERGYASPFLHVDGMREFHNLPRQLFEQAYVPNGVIDIIRPAIFLKTGLLHGDRIKILVSLPSVDIDTVEDYAKATETALNSDYKTIVDYLGSIIRAKKWPA